jgi:hypothetical protein
MTWRVFNMVRALGKLAQCLIILLCSWNIAQAQHPSGKKALSLEYRSVRHEWRDALIRNGFYNPMMPKPYRLAIPLIKNEGNGPDLMLGFAPRLRPVDGRNVILLFAAIPLD